MTWLTAPLRKVAPPVTAQIAFSPDDQVWQLSLDQIESESGEIVEKRYAAASDAGTSTFHFDTGNVLYSKLRPYLNKVAVPDEAGIATSELIPLRPDPKTLNHRFLAYYLRSPGFVNQASHHVAGAKMPRVVMDWFWAHEAPIPSPKEQSRIVELLDEADRLRRLRREADAKAARILPALFLKMFGDPATNPMGWPIESFSNIFDDTTAGNEKLQSSQFLEAGKIAVVDQGQSQIAGYSDDVSIAYRGKLPVIVFGDHTRIFKFIDHPFVLGADGVRVLTPKSKVNPLFAYWHCKLLNIPSAGYSRHFKYLKEKSFICPGPALQDRFSELTQTMTLQTSVLEKAAAKVEQLFSVLLDNAFSGQLTAQWREGHMHELLAEMAQQARALNLPMPKELGALP